MNKRQKKKQTKKNSKSLMHIITIVQTVAMMQMLIKQRLSSVCKNYPGESISINDGSNKARFKESSLKDWLEENRFKIYEGGEL